MNKKDPRAKRTRKMIIDAFARRIQFRDVESITVKELVEEAGLSRATFYLHFEDMPSFLRELTHETINDLIQYAVSGDDENPAGDPYYGFYKRFFDYIMENQKLFRGMLCAYSYPLFRQEFIRTGVQRYRQLLTLYRNSFEDRVSLDMLTHYIVYAHVGIVIHWLDEGCKYSSQYMAKQIQYLTVDGLKPIADLKGILVSPR